MSDLLKRLGRWWEKELVLGMGGLSVIKYSFWMMLEDWKFN
jgi:hypothetical protein